jgi:hypothetical protein
MAADSTYGSRQPAESFGGGAYTLEGKEKLMSFGMHPDVPLALARDPSQRRPQVTSDRH